MNSEVRIISDKRAPADSSTAKSNESPCGRWGVKIISEIALALAVYGMVGWIYVSICALIQPWSLVLPLTHLLPGLREDTSGVLSFAVSFFGFISYRLTRQN